MPHFGPRWQLIESKPIGKGGQSHAYLVREAEAGGRYVSKLFNGPSNPTRRERLEREIAICRELDHPNVIRFVDAGETEESKYPFLVTPYYEHGSLEGFRASLSDDPAEILSFFVKICDGVAHVHEKGIIHRDIKPANIFVGGDRQPVVGDFGISFRDQGDRLTESAEVVAPRWFGAPELRNGYLENPTTAADVYSLGKLLYWFFTGKVYDREEQDYGTPDRTLAGVLERSIPAYSFVDQIIDAAVQYDPEKQEFPEQRALRVP
jgi:serine/threonine protein kinase